MSDKRFYVIVPETVQVVVKGAIDKNYWSEIWNCSADRFKHQNIFQDDVKTFKMVPGRLLAQTFHIGRLIEHIREEQFHLPYSEETAISLSVRNTKELTKISDDLEKNFINIHKNGLYFFERFYDTNKNFYGNDRKVHTATAIGLVTQEEMDEFIGHLELYE